MGLAGYVLGACTPPPTQDLCSRVESYNQRCNPGWTDCQRQTDHANCQTSIRLLREDYIAAIDTCLTPDVSCGTDGGTNGSTDGGIDGSTDGGTAVGVDPQYQSCVCDRVQALQPTRVQHDAIQALCEHCPSFGRGGVSTEECVAANSMPPPCMPATGALAATSTLLLLSDAVAGSVRDCARAATGSPAELCVATTLCTVTAIVAVTDAGVAGDAGAATDADTATDAGAGAASEAGTEAGSACSTSIPTH
jgi:hypothetical protein